jgi:hypothetical protein
MMGENTVTYLYILANVCLMTLGAVLAGAVLAVPFLSLALAAMFNESE